MHFPSIVWLMIFILTFAVWMAIICQLELDTKVIIVFALVFIIEFFIGLTLWFSRATTYSVHGVSGGLVFPLGSTILFFFFVFVCICVYSLESGLCCRIREV